MVSRIFVFIKLDIEHAVCLAWVADPDRSDSDPDPNFHIDADPDMNPNFYFVCKTFKYNLNYKLTLFSRLSL